MTHEPRRVSGMSPQIEKRTATGPIQLRKSAEPGSAPVFTGRAIVYSTFTDIGDVRSGWGFREQIAPGALTKTLKEADVRFLVNHDSGQVVARSSKGTLTLTDTKDGLDVEAPLDTRKSYVRDLELNLEDGSVSGMSFGFRVVRDSWETKEEKDEEGYKREVDERTIEELALMEVSAVTFPAYPTTEAGLRSMVSEIRSARDVQTVDPSQVETSAGTPTEDERNASAEATRERMRILTMQSDALKARYNLP